MDTLKKTRTPEDKETMEINESQRTPPKLEDVKSIENAIALTDHFANQYIESTAQSAYSLFEDWKVMGYNGSETNRIAGILGSKILDPIEKQLEKSHPRTKDEIKEDAWHPLAKEWHMYYRDNLESGLVRRIEALVDKKRSSFLPNEDLAL